MNNPIWDYEPVFRTEWWKAIAKEKKDMVITHKELAKDYKVIFTCDVCNESPDALVLMGYDIANDPMFCPSCLGKAAALIEEKKPTKKARGKK